MCMDGGLPDVSIALPLPGTNTRPAALSALPCCCFKHALGLTPQWLNLGCAFALSSHGPPAIEAAYVKAQFPAAKTESLFTGAIPLLDIITGFVRA